MLSDEVLSELIRRTPSQQHVVALAWPSLTPSEHLQLVAAIQKQQGRVRSTPDWLLDLALSSPEPIVRYQALRHGYLLDTDVAGKERANKVASDPSEVVRTAVERFGVSTVKPEQLTNLPPVQRLLAIRHWDSPELEDFVDWIEAAHGKVSSSEVQAAVTEFFANPAVIEKLSPGKFVHPDSGYSEFRLSEGMKKGWALCATIDKHVAALLACHLPVDVGLDEMSVEDLVAMPSHVLDMLIYRDDDQVFDDLAGHILSHPEEFPESLRQTAEEARLDVRRYRRLKNADADARKEEHAEVRERHEQLTDYLAVLQEALGGMQNQLNSIGLAVSRRRGFFG